MLLLLITGLVRIEGRVMGLLIKRLLVHGWCSVRPVVVNTFSAVKLLTCRRRWGRVAVEESGLDGSRLNHGWN